jgi:hypothetical protein
MIEIAASLLRSNGLPVGSMRLLDDLAIYRFAAEYGLSNAVAGIWVTAGGRTVIRMMQRRLIEPRSAAPAILLAACIHRPVTLSPLEGGTLLHDLHELLRRIDRLSSDPDFVPAFADYDHPFTSLHRRLLALAAAHDLDLVRFGNRADQHQARTEPRNAAL